LIDHDIYRYISEDFIKISTINHINFVSQICGRNENDLFLWMKDGLAHYNGKNIEYLFNFAEYSIFMMADHVLLDKDIFFCGITRDVKLSLVMHGILKEQKV